MALGKLQEERCRQYMDLIEDKIKELTEAFVARSINSHVDKAKGDMGPCPLEQKSKGSLL